MANERIPGARTEPKHELCQKANRNPPKKKAKQKKNSLDEFEFVLRRSHHHSVFLSPSLTASLASAARMQCAICKCCIVAALRIPINNRKLKNVFSMLIKCWTRVKGSKMFALVYGFIIKLWLCVRARTHSHTLSHTHTQRCVWLCANWFRNNQQIYMKMVVMGSLQSKSPSKLYNMCCCCLWGFS